MRTRDLLRDGVVGQSNKNLAVVREAYQLGQLRLLDVLNEQRRLTDTELYVSRCPRRCRSRFG